MPRWPGEKRNVGPANGIRGSELSAAAASGGSGASIDAARAGSPDALAGLYRLHGAALYRLAYRLTGTREDAEDVVHDVFVGLPEALVRYEERGNFTAWLKRMTARVALIRLRRRKRRREVTLDAAGVGTGAPPTPDSIGGKGFDWRAESALVSVTPPAP